MALRRALVVMAREPVAGQTKTRLTPPLTAEEAAELYRYFLEQVLKTVRQASQKQGGIVPHVAYAPPGARDFFQRLAPDFALVEQVGERLNERLNGVFEWCFAQGYDQAAAINSDSPTLPGEYLTLAFERLETVDVVLGPCEDGGYYLLGLKRPCPEIILPVQMSTSRVLRDTLALVQQQGLTVSLLPEWYDVDTVKDLGRLQTDLNSR
jgi:rSAM/selenodomain-associated transferase 1